MGCGSSSNKGPKVDPKPKAVKSDDPLIEPIHVADWEDSYPERKPPPDEKDDIFDGNDYIDKDKQAATLKSGFDSYEALRELLNKECETDIDTVRAIFVWLFHQDIFNTFYHGVTDPHTPRGYMKLMKARQGTYEAFFALLCRAVNIPCAIVRGIGKGENYEVGEIETSGLESVWNAVYLKGSWRLVHLGWAYQKEKASHIENALANNNMNNNAGVKASSINEFFWLIDPPKMILFCRPDDNNWQLLTTTWNRNTFLQCPQLTEQYFTSRLKILKDTKAVITALHGTCSIKFDFSEKKQNNIILSGRLKRSKGSHYSDGWTISVGDEFSKELFIRFPEVGIFYLDVFGGPSSDSPVIAKFRLECEEIQSPCYPFPSQPEHGYTILTGLREIGISSLKPDNSVVHVKPKSLKEIQLKLLKNIDIEANMYHVKRDDGSLDHFVEVVKNKDGNLAWVKVTILDDPHVEYALQLSVRQQDKSLTSVANFLLVHDSWPHPPGQINKTDEIRKRLLAAIESADIKDLERAISDFKSCGLSDDDGDLTKALNTLMLLHLKNLRSATEARNMKEILSAIAQARNSCLADVIEPKEEMENARRIQKQLTRYKLILHKVLELKPNTITEIHSYPRPRPLIHNVMKATYKILGEPDENVESWESVKGLTKRIGPSSIINRIRNFEIIQLDPEDAKDAQAYLDQTNNFAVRVSSAGASTFYAWCKSVLSEYKDMSRELDSRLDTASTAIGFDS